MLIAALVMSNAACGRKGPPLTPFIRVPGPPVLSVVRVLDRDAYVQVTVPATNIDGSMPASVSRIQVYAATAMTPPPAARFLDIATPVATIPVAPTAEPGNPVVAPPDPSRGALQGAPVIIRETLTPESTTPRELAPRAGRPAAVGATAPVGEPRFLRRFYMAVALNSRNQPSAPSAIIAVPLGVNPEPPARLDATPTATGIVLRWEPSGGALGWLLDQGLPVERLVLPPELAAFVKPPEPPTGPLSGPTLYHVYRDMGPDPLAPPAASPPVARPWHVDPPRPITTAATVALTYTDPVELDERERCYSVRAVRGTAESETPTRACVTPFDVYPPARPTGLQAAGAEGQVNLVWDANSEPDLGGYIVLRREAGSATLLPLMTQPVPAARHVDREVKAGVQYFYAVVAVDSRVPLPNMSPPSVEGEATAR